MRWIPTLICSVAMLSAGATSAQPQPAAAKSPAPKPVAHIMLPPVPKPLLPDSFAGWVATDPLKTITDPAQADPANAAALKEYDFTDGVLASYKRGGETLSLHALRFHDASGALWRLFLLSAERLAQRRHRRRRNLKPQSRAVLAREYCGRCNFLPHRPHVRRGTA
jgi:hypothetical protein